MKLSTMLHRAADQYLPLTDFREQGYSCRAVWRALDEAKLAEEITRKEYRRLNGMFQEGCEELGLDAGSFHAFKDVPRHARQGARYQWLKFLALLAEEQGQ